MKKLINKIFNRPFTEEDYIRDIERYWEEEVGATVFIRG